MARALIVALAVDLDQRDLPALAEDPETQDLPEAQASPEDLQSQAVLLQFNHRASHAQEVNQDREDLPVPVVSQVAPDSQERAADQLRLDLQVHPVLMGNPDRQDNPELQDSQVKLPRLLKAKARRVHRETLELQDSQEAQDKLELQVNQAAQDQKDLQAVQANPATTVILANQEALENLAAVERREFAPNIALSMEESSSRMELVVVKRTLRALAVYFDSIPTASVSISSFITYWSMTTFDVKSLRLLVL